ncbi:MAG: hypothetical protein NTY68_03325 [Candidatus Micrarchaeota archaeon]|nr:hypothetical protein [Candidatus Micrarchaeota archaeon]
MNVSKMRVSKESASRTNFSRFKDVVDAVPLSVKVAAGTVVAGYAFYKIMKSRQPESNPLRASYDSGSSNKSTICKPIYDYHFMPTVHEGEPICV